MMTEVDKPRFRTALAFVMSTYLQAEMDPAVVVAYWQALAPRMTIDEFEAAANHLLVDDREFPPRPGAFLRAASSDIAHEARQDFARIMRSDAWQSDGRRSWLRSEVLAQLSPRAQAAVTVLGEDRLSNVDPGSSERDFVMRAWLRACVGDAEAEVRPPRIAGGGTEHIATVLDRLELPDGDP